jgi:hypothetical protein
MCPIFADDLHITPYDVYTGRHLEVMQRRKEAKSKTLEARKEYNRTAGSSTVVSELSINPEGLTELLLLTTCTFTGY